MEVQTIFNIMASGCSKETEGKKYALEISLTQAKYEPNPILLGIEIFSTKTKNLSKTLTVETKDQEIIAVFNDCKIEDMRLLGESMIAFANSCKEAEQLQDEEDERERREK